MISDSAAPLYDAIGVGYASSRQPDARIAAQMFDRLEGAASVVNVGAGAGSYEPTDRTVIAVEPSDEMVRQRPPGSAPAVRGVAAELPFASNSFDAAMAILTVHHWPSAADGLAEMRRVATGPIVVMSFDVAVHSRQWLIDYLPEMMLLDEGLPTPDDIANMLGSATVSVVDVPHDCVDGFCHAFWRRPEAYLQPGVRAAISGIARLSDDVVARAMRELEDDLNTGRWHDRYGDILDNATHDGGYRLIAAV